MAYVNKIKSIKQVCSEYIKEIKYINSGFKDLDEITRGFKKGEITIIGGRPGTGKTTLGVSLCRNIIESHSFSVIYLSLELSATKLLKRFLIQNENEEIDKIINSNIFICDPNFISVKYSSFEKSLRKHKEEKDLDLVIIDYFQLFVNDINEGNSILIKLKKLAKELNIAFVIFSQLNKDVDKRNNNFPLIEDLLQINGNDENIDNIFLIYRHKYHEINNLDLIIAKHMNAQGKTVTLKFKL
ncbi:MAG: DnaB-like helicase C-terminal domain-containing protein [Bacteroidales bacterium]|nr:DnaB-like helicase C-terminal domain-containing protein [Bacteroidales bacterium]